MDGNCDVCGAKGANMFYHLVGGEEEFLSSFVLQKSGKSQTGSDFELCGECNEEYKKFLSQNLKDKIKTELANKNLIDSPFFINYGYRTNFKENDWAELQKLLSQNIQHYRNEWQIKEMNYNRDGKEYFHPETSRRTSKLTILVHQSAPVEYSSNGFLIVKQPKMYLKSFFSDSRWAEIEKSLSQNSTQSPKFPTKLVFGLVLGGFLLVGAIIVALVYYRKRKQTK